MFTLSDFGSSSDRRGKRWLALFVVGFSLIVLLSACSRSSLPIAAPSTTEPRPSTQTESSPAPTGAPNPAAATPLPAPNGPTITLAADGQTQPFDRRLLGTNVPAWPGPSLLTNPRFITRTIALGSPLLRMPGGSWSGAYDWLACENGDQQACYWTWAARPTDFMNFMRATGSPGMWTVSVNGTPQEAAALVAFFNGTVDDTRTIGVDLRGRDWKTVGDWARLRAQHGNPTPLPIRLWEFGNEVYGGKAGAGAECASFGWEDVWTCDGTEYMQGKGSGATRQDGYLTFRTAMRTVDANILVGAVGVDNPSDWTNWGNEVIGIGAADLDFYVVHRYAYSQTPASAAAVLAPPQRTWANVVTDLNTAFDRYAAGRRAPIAVTEYNLVAFQDLDTGQLMRQAVNALSIADTIGQMATQGVQIANQWNLANGRAGNGTDYGLLDVDTQERNPQYYALALWNRFGTALLPVSTNALDATKLSLYAGRTADGALTLLAINKSAQPISATVRIAGATGPFTVTADTVSASTLTDTAVRFNGVTNPADDFADAPAQALGTQTGPFAHSFSPYSLTLLTLTSTQAVPKVTRIYVPSASTP